MTTFLAIPSKNNEILDGNKFADKQIAGVDPLAREKKKVTPVITLLVTWFASVLNLARVHGPLHVYLSTFFEYMVLF